MDNNFGGLEKAFDTSEPKPKKTRAIQNTDDQITDDHEYARSNLYSLIEKGQEAVDGALDVAQGSDHPRAYEVAAVSYTHLTLPTKRIV